jgi:anti-sigma B factor antagonist
MPDSDGYRIVLTEAEGTAVVQLSGELDLDAKAELTRVLAQAAGEGRDVIVDMSGTTFMDSTALKALLDARHSQTHAGWGFVLRNPSQGVLRTLQMAGLEGRFSLITTDD